MHDTPRAEDAASPSDQATIRELVQITRAGFASGHAPPFGSRIASSATGKTLVTELNEVVPQADPTCHAEVHAIRSACRILGKPNLKGYTLFSTCEPCPMCMTACLFSGLDRVVYGTVVRRPDATTPPLMDYNAKEFVRRSRFTCQVDGPVEEKLCRDLVDDPVVQSYLQDQGKKGFFI